MEIERWEHGERPGRMELAPTKSTSGIPGGLRISTVYVNLLSRKILIGDVTSPKGLHGWKHRCAVNCVHSQ